jgi:hypothetical protein
MDAPARPQSSAGIDGVAVVVSAPSNGALMRHLRVDEVAAARAAMLEVNRPAADPSVAAAAPAAMEVSAPPPAEAGFLDGLLGAVLGFLFG